ncbi:MAG TPA: thioredoxin domain-containing protein [Candidatus Saccharimonadales bacterium]|nr:thioredoxin domain-containing protein [Candidatus Saccharimonadales bacterium]
MDKTKWIIFSVIVLAVFGGLIWFNRSETPDFTGDASKIIYDGPIADHFAGTEDQKVVLIEYGDYQCPACARMYPTIKELEATYPDKLTFIFRNRPLTTIHPNALAAATAAEAAGLQGQYFAMFDLLYSSQDSWVKANTAQRTAFFENLAAQLGLDINKFNADLKSADISAKIARDRSTAELYGANSTPTFVLNGVKVSESDSTDPEALTKLISDAVNAAYPAEQQPQQ